MTRNFPLSYRVRRHNTYPFSPTGDPTVDTPAWEALVTAVNNYTPTGKSSEIVIRDNAQSMVLDTANSPTDTSEFLKGCMVSGETRNSRIQYNNGYIINWGRYGNPIRVTDAYSWFTRGTMTAMPAFSSRIQSPTISLAKGDWVLVWSTDNLSGVAPHHSGGQQRSAELHRVNHQDGGGWILDGFVVDPLTTTPSICKIDMLRGCGMRNLTFGSNGVDDILDTSQKSCVYLSRCHQAEIEDIYADDTGCGAISLQLCSDSRISNFSGTWQFNNRFTYAVTFGVLNNCVYQDSVWHGTRHILTSNGLQVTDGDGIRYGTARNCAGRNLDNHVAGDQFDFAFASCDLHAESWEFEFDTCRVTTSMYWDGLTEEFFAYSTRARRTRFKNCAFTSCITQGAQVDDAGSKPPGRYAYEKFYGQPANGIRVMGNDCQIINFQQNGGWRGALIQNDTVSTSFAPQRTVIKGGTFENVTGGVIYNTSTSDGIELLDTTIKNCGQYYTPSGSPAFHGSVVRLSGGTGHKIRRNDIDKGQNGYFLYAGTCAASDLSVQNNSLLGYGSGKAGIYGATGGPHGVPTANGDSINTAVAAKNNVDP